MPGRVAGKAIVITGAGSGMGRAFAHALGREGASIGIQEGAQRMNPRRLTGQGVMADGGMVLV